MSEPYAGIPITVFVYTNYRGETAERRVRVTGLRFGTSEYYLEPQWLVCGVDTERNLYREFAFAGIKSPESGT